MEKLLNVLRHETELWTHFMMSQENDSERDDTDWNIQAMVIRLNDLLDFEIKIPVSGTSLWKAFNTARKTHCCITYKRKEIRSHQNWSLMYSLYSHHSKSERYEYWYFLSIWTDNLGKITKMHVRCGPFTSLKVWRFVGEISLRLIWDYPSLENVNYLETASTLLECTQHWKTDYVPRVEALWREEDHILYLVTAYFVRHAVDRKTLKLCLQNWKIRIKEIPSLQLYNDKRTIRDRNQQKMKKWSDG